MERSSKGVTWGPHTLAHLMSLRPSHTTSFSSSTQGEKQAHQPACLRSDSYFMDCLSMLWVRSPGIIPSPNRCWYGSFRVVLPCTLTSAPVFLLPAFLCSQHLFSALFFKALFLLFSLLGVSFRQGPHSFTPATSRRFYWNNLCT